MPPALSSMDDRYGAISVPVEETVNPGVNPDTSRLEATC
jgi:hypothetical protein